MHSKRYSILLLTAILFFTSCNEEDRLFEKVLTKYSNIDFSNRIDESGPYNILNFEYVYNGGGIGIGDFNNDGLQDLFFTGNMVDNRLYLNKGEFKFQDISETAGIKGEDRWNSGVSVVDINNDGWLDIYVCATTYEPGSKRENQLYVNRGLNEQNIPVFEEQGAAYGVADSSHTTTAAFFDYDNDGDLDLYLAINQMTPKLGPNTYRRKSDTTLSVNADKLFRNNFSEKAGHPVFEDVSKDAGITAGGFSLGMNITDINEDGWKDIYVSNDYLSTDLMYVNNGNGTFTDMSRVYMKHFSYSAMGMNIADMNNDALADIFVLDMLPEYNSRRKTMLQPNNYKSYINNERFDYPYQHVRNTLQLNRGKRPITGELVFSEIGMFAGIYATDWSWSPVIADFDHNGFRDIIISNGFPKDITDHDFSDFMRIRGNFVTQEQSLQEIPSVRLHNYAFRNELEVPGGIPYFTDISEEWGIKEPSFSSGAACVDLDNDGDLDYVINNINDSAFVYRNQLMDGQTGDKNWINITFQGSSNNVNGIGAIAWVYSGGQVQSWENTPYRGYHSSLPLGAHFGLGNQSVIDSLRIIWPEGKEQLLSKVEANQHLVVRIEEAQKAVTIMQDSVKPLFADITKSTEIDFIHPESDYNDFSVQPLLLHKFSQFGPGIGVSDVNGDDLDDFYVGGSFANKGRFFVQRADGSFEMKDLLPGEEGDSKKEEELGILFFDADNDGDDDLYLVSGGYEFNQDNPSYQDRLFLNQNGRFILSKNALPEFLQSGSCVKAADYDKDNDLDLFIGGRVLPSYYPLPVSSVILNNDGTGKFRIADSSVAPLLENIGMISDALWTDYDNDGWVDLLLAGEWMPLTLLKNNLGRFDQQEQLGGDTAIGWWNSLASVDIDMDGDMDYVAGNHGLNTMLKASPEKPLHLFAGDFDNNMYLDLIPTAYFPNGEGVMTEYPFFGRKDMDKQIAHFKRAFEEHYMYGEATIDEVLAKLPEVETVSLEVNYLSSSILVNMGKGQFEIKALPAEAQLAPLYAILTGDFTGDLIPDILCTGNDFGIEISMGRADALNGLLLSGDGNGNFWPVPMQESGILIPGDGKSLVTLSVAEGNQVIIAGQNRDKIKVFESKQAGRCVKFLSFDRAAIIHLQNGTTYRHEVYYGDSFLSQSGRQLWLPENVKSIEILDYQNRSRIIEFTD